MCKPVFTHLDRCCPAGGRTLTMLVGMRRSRNGEARNVTRYTHKVLDRVSSPSDMKHLTRAELVRLADELREETISAVSVTGGHLGASLGVVELTVAIHALFDT